MPTPPIYVPMLKGKEGEFGALEALKPEIRSRLVPLIEIPDIPYDYANERAAKSLEDHVTAVVERLQTSWDGPFYLDLPWFDEMRALRNGDTALEVALAECTRLELKVIPVVSRTSSARQLSAAGRHAVAGGTGVCIRLLIEDFEEDIDAESEVNRILSGLGGVSIASVDLIVDMEDLGSDSGRALLVARSVFSMIPKGQFRRMILAGASFPEDLSEVDAATISTLPRREWDLWKTLQKRPKILPRPDLIFGDYAIAHPVPREIDPRTMRMSANIRYTARDNWLVVKGRNVRQYGFEQYFDLCKELVGRREFKGRDFSWGDQYIDDCANGMKGPGNATTWRKVGTNHHLTLVTRELANLHPDT